MPGDGYPAGSSPDGTSPGGRANYTGVTLVRSGLIGTVATAVALVDEDGYLAHDLVRRRLNLLAPRLRWLQSNREGAADTQRDPRSDPREARASAKESVGT